MNSFARSRLGSILFRFRIAPEHIRSEWDVPLCDIQWEFQEKRSRVPNWAHMSKRRLCSGHPHVVDGWNDRFSPVEAHSFHSIELDQDAELLVPKRLVITRFTTRNKTRRLYTVLLKPLTPVWYAMRASSVNISKLMLECKRVW